MPEHDRVLKKIWQYCEDEDIKEEDARSDGKANRLIKSRWFAPLSDWI